MAIVGCQTDAIWDEQQQEGRGGHSREPDFEALIHHDFDLEDRRQGLFDLDLEAR